jgi:hypothetical protein
MLSMPQNGCRFCTIWAVKVHVLCNILVIVLHNLDRKNRKIRRDRHWTGDPILLVIQFWNVFKCPLSSFQFESTCYYVNFNFVNRTLNDATRADRKKVAAASAQMKRQPTSLVCILQRHLRPVFLSRTSKVKV